MLFDEMLREIEQIKIIDIHTHLNRERLACRHPAEFMLYHMVLYELCAAGAPTNLISPWRQMEPPDPDETLRSFLPYFERISNTSFYWCLRTMFRDLFEVDEPITVDLLPKLRDAVARKSSRPGWAIEVMKRGNIVRSMSSTLNVKPLEPGEPDPGIRFGFESLPLSLIGRTKTYLLKSLPRLEEKTGIKINSIATLQEAMGKWFDMQEISKYRVFISWLDARIDVSDSSLSEGDRLLMKLREEQTLTDAERVRLDGSMLWALVGSLYKKVKVFQYVFGCNWVETGQKVRLPVADGHTRLGEGIGKLAATFPEMHFDILNGYEPAEPVLCSVAARMSNVSLSSMWWHLFYPSVMKTIWQRRIDMIPWTGLMGYFSDAYCIEWQYAKLQLARRVLASVLTDRVQMGLMREPQAIDFARNVLLETPKRLILGDEESTKI